MAIFDQGDSCRGLRAASSGFYRDAFWWKHGQNDCQSLKLDANTNTKFSINLNHWQDDHQVLKPKNCDTTFLLTLIAYACYSYIACFINFIWEMLDIDPNLP